MIRSNRMISRIILSEKFGVPAPSGLGVGQEVFFLRQEELPTEDGSLKSYWFIEESGIVVVDGMIRTSSPPWSGVQQSGTYIITVPKFTYPDPKVHLKLAVIFVPLMILHPKVKLLRNGVMVDGCLTLCSHFCERINSE